jgi:hypothetical protein
MQLLVILLLLTSIQAQQNPCLCSCCNSQSCTPITLPTVYVQTCTLQSCIQQCRATYPQCQGNYPTGYISVQCGSNTSNIVPQFNCQCECCNTGSALCSPSYVGNTLAYSCQIGACSIACRNQYPSQCVADQNGVTQGTCTGSVTTIPTTTIGPWLGNTCRCTYCQTGSSCSSTPVGVTSASYCSTAACTQACQNQYPSSCSCLSNNNQTSGTCISQTGGNTFCACNCCSTNGCINYRINTNGGCTMCDSICRQYTPCSNPGQVIVQSCSTNNAKISRPSIIFILIITIFTFYIIN